MRTNEYNNRYNSNVHLLAAEQRIFEVPLQLQGDPKRY